MPTQLALFVAFFLSKGGFAFSQQPPKAPVTVVTDPTWDVSNRQTGFGEYPLSADMCPSGTSTLYGGPAKAVVADYGPRSKIIPGSTPIWRNRVSDSEWEAYQFRKNIPLGADPIQKVTLEINCDDVARVYINKRLVSAEKRDGTLKDGYDDWYTFRSVTGFTSGRVYTYDVTGYFFTNVTNTVVIEAVSLAFDGSHAYVSAKLVFEFAPKAEQVQAPAVKSKPSASVKPESKPAAPATVPETTVFNAGSDPAYASLQVGSTLELGNVYFKADESALDAASHATLDALAAYMKRHPGLTIEVGGHTNLRPSDRFAAELSAKRAKAVVDYLKNKGVAADRMTHKGYGKTQPKVNAVSKEADKVNQRVEVKVLGK